MTGPIVRRWEAMIARADIAPWLETFRARAYPGMQAVEGFKGITIHAERGGDPCRVTVMTKWENINAIKRYAGDVPEKTVMPDFMARFFPSYDAKASFHDELMRETRS